MSSNSIKIAYIGGGSKAWAWKLMSDLATDGQLCGSVDLYDIDYEAAKRNETIGNRIENNPFTYRAVDQLRDALTGADFIVISILPGTFDEMESDVHAPEAYGIYQSVGDTSGPGGILRAMRTIPMYIDIAQAIERYAPSAWVINYTNPMTMCVDTLYRVFPGIKAFGCCHEVFGTQKLLCSMLAEMKGIQDVERSAIKVNVLGINHFTWLDKAQYQGIDLFPLYREFAEKHLAQGIEPTDTAETEQQRRFSCKQQVKFDLFLRYGLIAAAGDRHLAEFCPGQWYLKDPATVQRWGFGLTPVSWRRADLQAKLQKAQDLISGQEQFIIDNSGEEGVLQIKAILGLGDLVTNVNLPNRGQAENMELGRVVETNAHFTSNRVTPVLAGALPAAVHGLVARVSDNQKTVVDACLRGDMAGCLPAFVNDPLVTIPRDQAEELFGKMVKNTEKYLGYYTK